MTDRMIRISFEHWQKLRTAAFHKCKHIKTLLNEILDGKIDPATLEKIDGDE